MIVYKLTHANTIYHLYLTEIRFDAPTLKQIIEIGLPNGLQSVMYSLSNIIVQVSINSFGTDTIAAWTAYGKADGLFWMIIGAFGIAATTFSGQNFGAKQYDRIKIGRTQLQDAVPVRLGQEFCAYASALQRDIHRMEKAKDEMRCVNLGGTAVGTSLNADPRYVQRVVLNLDKITGLGLTQAYNLFDSTQNLDEFVAVSGSVKACAVTLSKIANDLRLMSSGPRAGLGEITLPPRQNGSSIMPGKVNPVIPEVVNQVAFNIIGNDVTITLAAEAGQFELNAFEPIVFYCLFQSIDTLAYAVNTFIDNCVAGITPKPKRCRELLEASVGCATALCPIIGYQAATELAKRALSENRPLREIALESGLLSPETLEQALDPVRMVGPD